MNKVQIYFLKSQETLTMAYKYLIRKIKVIIITFLICFLHQHVFSNIIYDKSDIIITEIELNQYRDLYYQTNKQRLNENSAIKKLVLLKKTINRLERNKPEVIKNLDNLIVDEFGDAVFKHKIKLDFIRYLKIRNQFIIDYYNNELDVSHFKKIIKSFSEFNVPISNNNCLTIIKVINIKEDDNFIKSLYLSFLNKKKNIQINIDKKIFNVCITDKDYKLIENQIIKYIEINTLSEFNKFIYEN